MNIAFDAKRAFLNSSGLGNYARTLIKSLHQYYPENKYSLFTTHQPDTDFQKFVSVQKNISIQEPHRFIDKTLRSRWRSFGITELLNDLHINVYHGLSNELPFNIKNFKGKKIVTIHDLVDYVNAQKPRISGINSIGNKKLNKVEETSLVYD